MQAYDNILTGVAVFSILLPKFVPFPDPGTSTAPRRFIIMEGKLRFV